MMSIVLSLTMALLIGMGILTCFLAKDRKRLTFGEFILRLSLALGVGIGTTSILLFVYLHFFPIKYYVATELSLTFTFIVLLLFIYRHKLFSVWTPYHSAKMNGTEKALAAFFLASLVFFVSSIVLYFPIEPHGKWDAWASWNSCARFIYGSGDALIDNYTRFWQTLGAQATYPWLYPLSTARVWIYNGGISQVVPFLLNTVFALATIGLAFGFLQLFRSRLAGWFAGLFLLGTPFFAFHITSQYADILLGYYFLASAVLFSWWLIEDGQRAGMLALVGVLATLAAWTKEEGMLFLLIIFALQAFYIGTARKLGLTNSPKVGKNLAILLGGALPGLLLLGYYRFFFINKTSTFISDIEGSLILIEKILDPTRYITIILAFIKEALFFTAANFTMVSAGVILILVYVLLVGLDKNRIHWRSPYCAPLLIFVSMYWGYFAAYVITPFPLQWHLDTSLNRFLLQIYPLSIVITICLAKPPEEIFTQRIFPPPSPPPSKAKEKQRKVKKKR